MTPLVLKKSSGGFRKGFWPKRLPMFASYSVHDPEHSSRLVVPIQGVRVCFSSRVEGLIKFAQTHFGGQDGGAEDPISTQVPGCCSGQAEIEACLEWIEGTAPK